MTIQSGHHRSSRASKRCSLSPGPRQSQRQRSRSAVGRRGRSAIRSEHHPERRLTPAPFRGHPSGAGSGAHHFRQQPHPHHHHPHHHHNPFRVVIHPTSSPAGGGGGGGSGGSGGGGPSLLATAATAPSFFLPTSRSVDEETISTTSSTTSSSQHVYGSLMDHYFVEDGGEDVLDIMSSTYRVTGARTSSLSSQGGSSGTVRSHQGGSPLSLSSSLH